MTKGRKIGLALASALVLGIGATSVFFVLNGPPEGFSWKCARLGGEIGPLFSSGYYTGKNACRKKLPKEPQSRPCSISEECGKDGVCEFGDIDLGPRGGAIPGWCDGKILFVE